MKQVLVIEDDYGLAQLLSTIIGLAGFNVEVAYTGNDGVARLKEGMPDAIILDMHLPGVSGRAIYEMLEDQQQAFRVIVCSADVQLVDEYKSKGANAVAKPIERIDTFMAMIIRVANHTVPV